MKDVLYVAGTLTFFALMLAYVVFCAELGKPREAKEGGRESR